MRPAQHAAARYVRRYCLHARLRAVPALAVFGLYDGAFWFDRLVLVAAWRGLVRTVRAAWRRGTP